MTTWSRGGAGLALLLGSAMTTHPPSWLKPLRLIHLAVALGLAACVLGTQALATPIVTVTGDGMGPMMAPIISNEDGTFQVDQFKVTAPNGEWEVTINAFLDPDPMIIYTASVIDFGNPSTFSFVFSIPIVATPVPGFVSHTHSSSTTDNGLPAGTSVTAVSPPIGIPIDGDSIPEIAVYTLSTNGGATFLNAGLDLSPSFVGASPSGTQGPFTEGPIAGPALLGFYDTMRIDVSFSMGGNNDVYSFNGTAIVNAIPEPSGVLLFSVGMLVVGRVLRRRSA